MSAAVSTLSEWESLQLLGPALPRPRQARTMTVEEAAEFAASTGTRLVAKASGVAHKSDLGLVRVDLTAQELEACWAELAAAGDGSVLVAELMRGELELIVGGSRDPNFGALITVGLGGVAAEAFNDVAVILSPPEPGELDNALSRLRGSVLLNGYRGAVSLDRKAFEQIVGLVADLLDNDPDVIEIDCNPVIVAAGIPTVLDALVVKRRATP